MSVNFSTTGRDREVIEVYEGHTKDSCIRCLTSNNEQIVVVVGKLEFTLCDNCYETFVNKLDKFADRKWIGKFAFWRKKHA